MNAWQEYKKSLGDTRPWDLLNPNVERSPQETIDARMDICNECPELIKITKQCKQCGCFMAAKVKLAEAKCPLSKW
jgi:hypothetical protein